MTIPAEARNAAEEAMVEFFIGRKGDQHGLDAMLEAAAPHIARAARIDEIRAIADWLDEEAHKDFLDSDTRPHAADKLRERADEMEAKDEHG